MSEEEWDYVDHGVFKQTRTSRVCMTCQHFSYTTDNHCYTLLTCAFRERLLPHGEHLTQQCVVGR